MAAGVFTLVLLVTVLTDATPINTQVQNLQHQMVKLNGVLDNVINEFGNLRQKHEDLETKFNRLSVELRSMRNKQETMNRQTGTNIGGSPEEQSATSHRSVNVSKETLVPQDLWKGQGQHSGNVRKKVDMSDNGLTDTKGGTGYTETKRDTRSTGLHFNNTVPAGNTDLKGPKGDPGPTGPKGDTGPTGPIGHNGPTGSKGHVGLPGPKGHTGSTGPKGHNGNTGPRGGSGNNGQKGHDGSKGEPGVNGEQQKIAFHAKLLHDLQSPSDDELIIMSSDVVLVGSGYDKSTGIFTCPVAGWYIFSVTAVVHPNGSVEVELVRNGQAIIDIYGGAEKVYGSGSNMALVHLHVNDKVWVQVHGEYHRPGSILVNDFTTFSGFLLYAQ